MESIDLRKIIQPLLRWWWLLLAAGVLAGLSSYFYVSRQPDLYESRTTVIVGSFIQDPNPDNNNLYLAQNLASNYAEFLQRSTIRQATMESLGMTWLPNYTARSSGQLVEIAVVDTEPARAQQIAQELANQLILHSPTGQAILDREAFVEQRLAKIEKDIFATEAEVERKQTELANEFSAIKIRRLQEEIATLEAKVNALQTAYSELSLTSQQHAANGIRMFESAGLPGTPMAGGYLRSVAVAIVFGLVLAASGAYLIEFLDQTVKTSEQVQNLVGLSTLGAIPKLDTGKTADDSPLIMLHNNLAPAAEAYRVLRINLQYASIDRALGTVQVTSASPGEGKSLTAADLSAALAHSDKKVVLIDADLRRPMQHKLFGLANNFGVTSALLTDLDSVDQLLQKTPIPNLRVLTSGPLPPDPSELLGSQRMQDLLHTLGQDADVLVIDSAPVTVVSDSAIVASRVDGVLLVVKAGSTRNEMLQNATDALAQVDAHILGAVLNEVKANESGYYYNYGQRYGYTNAYSNAYTNAHNQTTALSVSDGSGPGRGKRKQGKPVTTPLTRAIVSRNNTAMTNAEPVAPAESGHDAPS